MNNKTSAGLVASVLMVMAGSANAVLIDDFNDNQSVSVINGTVTDTVSGGAYIGTDRTLTASNSVGQTQAFINSLTPSSLDASNTTTASGTVSVDWTGIANVDLTEGGLAESLFLSIPDPIDNDLDVEFLINGTSVSNTSFPNGTSGDDFVIPFASFSDPSVFGSVVSISMTLSDGLGWDASIDFVETRSEETPPIPEPATLALIGLGLAGIGYRRRNGRKA